MKKIKTKVSYFARSTAIIVLAGGKFSPFAIALFTKLNFIPMKPVNRILICTLAFVMLFFTQCKKDKNVPRLTTMPVAEIGSTSALCGGNIINDEGKEIISKGLVWATNEKPTIENNSGSANCSKEEYIFSVEMLNLSSGTKYFVRAFASNSDGVGYGDTLSFTTSGSNGENPSGVTPCSGMATFLDTRKTMAIFMTGIQHRMNMGYARKVGMFHLILIGINSPGF
jgi:hypothetical protein